MAPDVTMTDKTTGDFIIIFPPLTSTQNALRNMCLSLTLAIIRGPAA